MAARKTHRGTAAFIALRATSVPLVGLAVWFAVSFALHAGDDAESLRAFLAEPLTAFLMALLLIVSAWHMAVGMAEVIEDYVHSGLKGVWLTLNWIVALFVAGLSLVSAYILAV
jgi:succinate dehydrogenase / fumarate reductase membrane anchor subunit